MKFIIIPIILIVTSAITHADVIHGKKEVLLDNATVEVVRLIYPVGTESGMHTHKHPNRVVYFIKGGVLELVSQNEDQPPKIINASDVQTLFLPTTTHNVRNIGNTEIIIIETEIKNAQ